MDDIDQHFQTFARVLERAIARYGHGKMPREKQKSVQADQLRRLLILEERFRDEVAGVPAVWLAFVQRVASRSVSSAQPFFRERQAVFNAAISPLLKAGDAEGLARSRFRVNRLFIDFALGTQAWPADHALRGIAAEADVCRRELVELNLPLGVGRARTFWASAAKRPGARLTFMDFVQISATGLLIAVDKFMPTGDPAGDASAFAATCDVFPSVAITRMSGFFIQNYSETVLHYSSSDRRRLYRAKRLLSSRPPGEIEFDAVVEEVNRGVEPARHVTADEVASMLAASTVGSTDAVRDREDAPLSSVDEPAAPESDRPDIAADDIACRGRMRTALGDLSLRHRKVLMMRGVET